MKQKLLLLLLIPCGLLSGLFYGFIAHKLVRDKEPWFTLLLIGGLACTTTFITWLGGIPVTCAAWIFIGASSLYLVLRLLFGKGNALEMICLPHVLAILALLAWPVYEKARQKVDHQLNTPAAP